MLRTASMDDTMFDDFALDIVEEKQRCCGAIYQAQGALGCCQTVFCGRCCGHRRTEYSKVVPYFLDLWTLAILGGATIVFLLTLILRTYLAG